MKKNLYTLLLMAVALFSAVTIVSCGIDDDDPIPEPPTPDTPETGQYSIYFPELTITYWPDTEAGIVENYEAYKKSITDALKVDTEKKYLLTELLANKDRLQAVYDKFGDYEYKVKSCRNYFVGSFEATFRVYKNKLDSHPEIDFGAKKVRSLLDVPAGSKRQLLVEMVSYEKAVPSAKEYLTNIRNKYTDALKEVFGGEYGTMNDNTLSVTYTNIANLSDNYKEVLANMKTACGAVEVPALPDDIKAEAQAVTSNEGARLSDLFNITITSFDITKTYPNKADTLEFENNISVK